MNEELLYIKEKAALLSLYQETKDVASKITNKENFGTLEWKKAYVRFYELYHSDLVYYGESMQVEAAMVDFKKEIDKLLQGLDPNWKALDQELLKLAKVLSEESNKLRN